MSTHHGILRPTGGHIEPRDREDAADWRLLLTFKGTLIEARLPSGKLAFSGRAVVEGNTLLCDLWDPWGIGFRVVGTRGADGYALEAHTIVAAYAAVPLVDDAAAVVG